MKYLMILTLFALTASCAAPVAGDPPPALVVLDASGSRSTHGDAEGVEGAGGGASYLSPVESDPGEHAGWFGEVFAGYSTADGEFDLGDDQVDELGADYATVGVGVRWYPDVGPGWARPYLGAGGALRRVDVESAALGESYDDLTFGGVGRAGLEFDLGGLRLGVEYRRTLGFEVEVDGEDFEADDEALALTLAWELGS